jgi:hypothetical protein
MLKYKQNIWFLWLMQTKIQFKNLENIFWRFQCYACCCNHWRKNTLHARWAKPRFKKTIINCKHSKANLSTWLGFIMWFIMVWPWQKCSRLVSKSRKRNKQNIWAWCHIIIFGGARLGFDLQSPPNCGIRLWVYCWSETSNNF